MSEGQELARRETTGDALSQILGGGDTAAMIAQVERNVRTVLDVARQRGFITKFRQTDQRTGEIRETEFYGLPAWQILGMTYGLTPFIEWVHPVDGGFHARAVAQTRDGMAVSAAEAFCYRAEPGKRNKSAHELAAVAQARAQRNALRAAMGAALVLAGIDVPDPNAPATSAQIGLLHQLERELDMTHAQGHERAGVESYKDLDREQAAELIDEWTAERAASSPAEQPEPSPSTSPSPGGTPAPSDPSSGPGGASGKASVGGATSTSAGPEDPSGGVGDGEAPAPPADPWDVYHRARVEHEWQKGTQDTDRLIGQWWRERKLGPPKPSWEPENLLALADALEQSAAQRSLEGSS